MVSCLRSVKKTKGKNVYPDLQVQRRRVLSVFTPLIKYKFFLIFLTSVISVLLLSSILPQNLQEREQHSIYCFKHLFFGIGLSSAFLTLLPLKPNRWVIAFVLLMVLLWEFYKNPSLNPNNAPIDTILDIVLGLLGGLLPIWLKQVSK